MAIAAHETASTELPMDTGVDRDHRRELATELGKALASCYVLYHKTHAYHWNITGPLFYSVHKLTDEQYEDIAKAIDDIAERIRSIGFAAPTGLGNYLQESIIEDAPGIKSAGDMIKELAEDNQAVARQLRPIIHKAEEVEDVYTADLLTARIGAHEEASWMLNALVVDKLESAAAA